MGVIHGSLGYPDHGFIVVRGGIDIDAEEFGKLGGGDDDGCGIGEAVDHRSYNFV